MTATVVLSGGQTAYNFNGRVRFHSSKFRFSNIEADFYNGVATTYIEPVQGDGWMADDITAEIIKYDSEYANKLRPILNKTHQIEVYYEPPLQRRCTRE